jgi:hypothetical protein
MRLAKLLAAANWKYALVEVALIVVGVTIALWADAWVTSRGDRAQELARLHALHDNIENTIADLRVDRELLSGAVDALRKLASLKTDEQDSNAIRDMLRYGLLYGSTFHPELNVYDDLKSSGELGLITSPALRRGLAKMDSRMEVVRYAQADLTTVQQLDIDSYMVDRLDLRWLYGAMTGLDPTDGRTEVDLDFCRDVNFQNRLLLKLDLVTQLDEALSDAENALLEVQQIINAQIAS